jgi:carbon monoxide dehydrogenase subunit G
MKAFVWTALVVCLGTLPVRADFSYQEDSKITGGALAAVMKFAGAFSKQAREPMVTHVYVKGHRMARVHAHSADIIDADKETITRVDFDHKTYSVMTFAQFREQMEQMQNQAKQKAAEEKQKNPDAANVDMQVKVSTTPTGQTKDIDGLSAKEILLTMSLQGTDPKTGETGSMDVKSDMWMARVPGYEQVREVHKLIGEKLGFVPGGSGLAAMQRPDLAKDMGELYKEIAKMDGMPVESVLQMGGSGTGNGTDSTGANSTASSNQSQPAPTPSASEAARSAALSRLGALGGFGGFGRHKKHDQDQDQQQQQQTTTQPAADANGSQSGGLLLEMTTHASNFSNGSVDENNFAVPAGFKQVEPAMERETKGR